MGSVRARAVGVRRRRERVVRVLVDGIVAVVCVVW